METLTYWVTRLEPLIRDNSREEIIVVFCNRTGIEDDVTYAGTSAVIGILDGEVHVYGILGRGQKELLVVDTNQPPYAKLVHRPQGSATDNGTDQAAPSGENDDKGPQPDGSGDKEERDDNESKGPVPGETGDPSPDGSSVSGRSHSSRGSFKSASNNSVGPSKRAGRKKPVDPIMVPPRGYQNHGDGDLKTPGSAAIPTPSAPSPTPMALRPRLIIPESPPFQHPIDRLDSAASFLSDRTEASLQSDFSEASIQTIRSNGRPPEDSTPYPHSGAPLSGYPSNSFHGSSHSLSSSTGSARDFGDFRSDARPYDSTSPYAGSPWRSPDYLNTPKSFGAGTPIGRRPEPFPWEAITGTPQADPTPAVAATPGNTFVPVPESNSGRRPSRSVSSNRTTQASNSRSGSVAGRQSRASVRSTKRATGEESMSRRRNPPKSRSASCFRNDERSHSSFGERNATGSLGLYVDDLPQRAESANSMRTPIAPSATPVFERPPSPKSRNCSRSRPELDEGLPIPISACPSILPPMTSTTPEAREFYRSASNSRRRVGGRRTSDAVNPGLYTRTASPFTGPNASTSSSRTVARGRSPRPQMMTAPPLATERSSSIDSVRNDRLHTRVSRRGSRSQANDGTPHRHYRSVSRPQEDLSQFERVEAIVCAHCPLHGNGTPGPDAPASGGHHASNHGPASSGPSRRSESRQNPSRSTSRDSQASADGRAETFADRSHSRARVETSSSHGSPSQATDVSDSDWSLQGASSQSVSSASQSVFDPPTPRAMSFDKKRDEMSLTLAGLSESTVEIALAPYDDVSPVSTVKTPVASLRA